MDHFAGLDVSVKETSVCIVDDTGEKGEESEGGERARGAAASSDEPQLPVQADWIGSRATIAVAF